MIRAITPCCGRWRARGEANVLAVIISSTNDYSAPCARAIARYHDRPNIPIGANKENIPNDYAAYFSYYTQQAAATQFGTPGETRFDYPDAVTVYRQTLAGALPITAFMSYRGAITARLWNCCRLVRTRSHR
jgi:hypothetical protein